MNISGVVKQNFSLLPGSMEGGAEVGELGWCSLLSSLGLFSSGFGRLCFDAKVIFVFMCEQERGSNSVRGGMWNVPKKLLC